MYRLVEFLGKHAVAAMVMALCLWVPCRGQNAASSTAVSPLPSQISAIEHVAPKQNPLVVTYHDGQLEIDAENASLADVLQLVAQKTGALIDLPPGSGLERIVEHAGPGHAEDVLARLLNGSTFDFVIAGSSRTPRNPIQVLLFPRKPDAAASKQEAVALARPAGEEPHLYGAGFRVRGGAEDSAEVDSAPTVVNPPPGAAASGDYLPGDVLDQMQKERLRQRHLMQEQQQQANQPPSN
jgi:hypothetical protein